MYCTCSYFFESVAFSWIILRCYMHIYVNCDKRVQGLFRKACGFYQKLFVFLDHYMNGEPTAWRVTWFAQRLLARKWSGLFNLGQLRWFGTRERIQGMKALLILERKQRRKRYCIKKNELSRLQQRTKPTENEDNYMTWVKYPFTFDTV